MPSPLGLPEADIGPRVPKGKIRLGGHDPSWDVSNTIFPSSVNGGKSILCNVQGWYARFFPKPHSPLVEPNRRRTENRIQC